jgi:hypothetical protein
MSRILVATAAARPAAALACPRYDDRYQRFEQPAALAAQPRASYCVRCTHTSANPFDIR